MKVDVLVTQGGRWRATPQHVPIGEGRRNGQEQEQGGSTKEVADVDASEPCEEQEARIRLRLEGDGQ